MKHTSEKLKSMLDAAWDIKEYLKRRAPSFIEWAASVDFGEETIYDIWQRYERINPRFPPTALRRSVIDRFAGVCQNCGSKEKICVDHVIPYSKGGWTVLDNLTLLCKTCNSKKKDRL